MTTQAGRFQFNISTVGPSRIGKTTLITALLEAGQHCFQGTTVSLNVRPNTATERRVSRNRKQLDAHILARSFDPGGLAGTSEMFIYELVLDCGVPDHELSIEILDFPGGWLDPHQRPGNVSWQSVLQRIRASTILLVPIDATVLMEAVDGSHRSAWPYLLTTDDVCDVVRAWAKERAAQSPRAGELVAESIIAELKQNAEMLLTGADVDAFCENLDDVLKTAQQLGMLPTAPALLVFAPLKCESYFVQGSKADQLYKRFLDLYGEIARVALAEYAQIQLLYCAVDSIGCVELESADWTEHNNHPHLDCRYRVRPPFKRCPRAADIIMRAIAYQYVSCSRSYAHLKAYLLNHGAGSARQLRPTSWFGTVAAWFSGRLERIDRFSHIRRADAKHHLINLEKLEQTLNTLGDLEAFLRAYPDRARWVTL